MQLYSVRACKNPDFIAYTCCTKEPYTLRAWTSIRYEAVCRNMLAVSSQASSEIAAALPPERGCVSGRLV